MFAWTVRMMKTIKPSEINISTTPAAISTGSTPSDLRRPMGRAASQR